MSAATHGDTASNALCDRRATEAGTDCGVLPVALAAPLTPAVTRPSGRYAKYIARVGGLAVALGVGAAVATGLGAGDAHADTDSSSSDSPSTSSRSEPPSDPTSARSRGSGTSDSETRGASGGSRATGRDSDASKSNRDNDATESTAGEKAPTSVSEKDTDAVAGSATESHIEAAVDATAADDRPVSNAPVIAEGSARSADGASQKRAPIEETTGERRDPVAPTWATDAAAADEQQTSGVPKAVPSPSPTAPTEPVTLSAMLESARREIATLETSDSTEIVTGLYREILRQDPTPADLAKYTNLLNWTGIRTVVASLYNSTAFRQEQVNSYYFELLGRAPSEAELAPRTFLLQIGIPEPLVIASIAGSDEFYEESGDTATSYVRLLYRSLLGQSADVNELPIYVQRLQAGLSPSFVAWQFVTSDPFREAKLQETFQVVLGRTPSAMEVSQYVDNWLLYGGNAGISKRLLRSAENINRMTQSGGIPLPNMTAVDQLEQILMAAYNEQPNGFVNLFNQLLQTSDTGQPCNIQPCNTALWELIKTGGATRGIPNESIEVAPMTLNVGALLPTQNEIGVNNSLGFPLQHADTLQQYLVGGTLIAGSVIMTANGGTYIVDGHHRWSSVYVINPYAQISAIDLGYVPDAQEALKETQVAIAADLGYLPVQTVSGPNLFTIDKATFDASVQQLIESGSDPDAVMEVFADVKGLDDMESIQDYLWVNVLRMRTFNQPVPGATGRGYMPQPPEYETILHIMESGDLNYTLPVIAYLG